MPLLVGISAYAREGDPLSFSLPCAYVDAVRAVGAIPLILPPGEEEPGRLLDHVDGLIFAGGGDLAPDLYGGSAHDAMYGVCEERDRYELDLANAAIARGEIPILCICRGMQLLNVIAGGTLHAHIPERFGEEIVHRLPPCLPTRHPVKLDPSSRVAGLVEADNLDVVSWHHQALDRLGSGLRAVAWAPDGVVEAVEYPDHPWCFGVQWHPEMQHVEPPHRSLFEAFCRSMRTA